MNITGNFDLVKAQPSDLTTIKQILRACQLPGSDLTDYHLRHFFILKNDSEGLGTVGLEIYGTNGLLRSLATKEKIRGKGLGKLLVNTIEQYAQQKNISALYLLTTTAEDFFGKLGYLNISRNDIPEEVKNSKEFSSICPGSAASMIKHL